MHHQPFLPGDSVSYQYYLDSPPVKGTVTLILPSGLIQVELDTGQILLTNHYFLKHLPC